MKSIVALLLVSAVLSASAVGPAHDLFDGFVTGLNDSYLTQDILSLHDAGDIVSTGIDQVIQAAKTHDVDAVASSLEELFADIHQFAVVSHNVLLDLENVLQTFANSSANFSTSVLMQHVQANTGRIMADFSNATSGNPFTIGYTLADLLKIVALGNTTLPVSGARSVRKLLQNGPYHDAITYALDVILFVQGFLEQANTTINVTDYQTFANDVTTSALLADSIVADIKTKNYSALFNDAHQFYANLYVTLNDTTALRVEVAQWINRDLPLFTNSQRLTNAAEAMVINYAQTKQNIQSIQTALNQSDFEGAGNGVAALYNEFYNGLLIQ